MRNIRIVHTLHNASLYFMLYDMKL